MIRWEIVNRHGKKILSFKGRIATGFLPNQPREDLPCPNASPSKP